jgi:hypothetical protein
MQTTHSLYASDKVYQLLAHDRWFSPGSPASSTTKTGRHVITEILLKVALKHQKSKSNHDSDVETTVNCKILSCCHVTNMGVSTTEMNSNMWSVLTNSKSADFIISMLHQMFTTGHTISP